MLISLNKVVKTLIVTDIFIYSSWGLIMPVLAVFIVNQIKGGDESVAGIAIGLYWVVKSLLQVPIGWYLDKNHGEIDDYWFMVIGVFIASLSPLLFLVSTEPIHIYGLQALHAVGMAMAIPPWGGIFTRHIDKGREAETWGIESSALGIGIGIAGILGGFVAKTFGFEPLFVAVSLLGLAGAFGLLIIRKDIYPKKGLMPYPKKVEHIH